MEETLTVLNRMEEAEIIGRYAIGGAIAASYYVEPTVTYDLDIFTALEERGGLVDLGAVFGWLRSEGYLQQGAGVLIGSWEVQFLVPGNPLVQEALDCAVDVQFGSTPTRVFTAEHLAMVMLQLGRPKDRVRLAQFLDEGALDLDKVAELAPRFELGEKWKKFQAAFGELDD